MSKAEKNISVLVSGGGTNFQAVADAINDGRITNGRIVQVISSSDRAYALERAEKLGIKSKVIGKKNYPDMSERTSALIKALDEEGTDLVILAGYMSILSEDVIKAYRNKIINIHPSLIPLHCGMGMYGIHVHEDVIKCGDKESGATVHFVDEGVDTGKIILQRSVPVKEGDTPEELAARVLTVEHQILPEAVNMFCNGMIGEEE